LADENQTDETNSTPAVETQTEGADQTGSDTSTTPKTEGEQPKGDGDPLDGPDGLGADPNAQEGDDKEGEGENELLGAPEGDYELELPEGMALDEEALKEFAPIAKEANLSNAGLSKLAANAYPIVEKQVTNAMASQVVAQRKEWDAASRQLVQGGKDAEGNEVKPDPLFAGENMDTVLAVAAKAIDRFAGDALYPNVKFDQEKNEMVPGTFRDFLKTTGLGNHPAMIRAFYVAGKSISEDSDFHRTGDVPPAKLSREEKYYGASAT
jgi:hypothetical protein